MLVYTYLVKPVLFIKKELEMERCEGCGVPINWIFFHTCVNCGIKRANVRSLQERREDRKLFFRFLKNLLKGHIKVKWVERALPKYYRGKVGGPEYSSYIWWLGKLHLSLPLEETRDTTGL